MISASLLCRLARPAARIGPSGQSIVRCTVGKQTELRRFWGRAGAGSLRVLRAKENGVVSRGQWVRRLSDEKNKGVEDESKPPSPPTPNPNLPTTPAKLLSRVKSLTPHENIYTIPNILTFSRLAVTPVIGYLVLHDQHIAAVSLFAYAGITDLVDGWIARTFNQQTVVGTVIDPMADKTLMTVLTVCLAIQGSLPLWVAVIIIGRDVGLAISAIYYRWISLPPPKTFARYWDFSLPSAEVRPTGISKVNTALQLGLIGWTVTLPLLTGYGDWVGMATVGAQYLVATTTVWSGLSYVYTKDAVKILTQEDIDERQRKAGRKD